MPHLQAKPPTDLPTTEARLLAVLTETPARLAPLTQQAGWKTGSPAREAAAGLRAKGLCQLSKSTGPGQHVLLAALTPAGADLQRRLQREQAD